MCIRDSDYTLVYHCLAEKPYFDSLATYNSLYPAPKALVEQMGPEAVSYTHLPKYWDTECKRFDTVTYKMVESNDIVYQMYELSLIHI